MENIPIPSGEQSSPLADAPDGSVNQCRQPFTKGPWAALNEEDGRNYARVRGTRLGERFKIANVLFALSTPAEIEEARANARLIASAPELYEALVDLVRAVNTNELAAAMACHEIIAFSNVEDALKLALPALRKARGEVA